MLRPNQKQMLGALSLASGVVLSTVSSVSLAQGADSPVPARIEQRGGIAVQDVRIEGLQRIEPGTIFSYLPIQVGDRVTDQSVTEAIRALFATGFFTDVRIELDGNVLVILLEERPAIGVVEVTGAKEFDKEQLLKALRDSGLSESRIFDRSLLDKAEQELKRQYLGRGKYDVKIVSTVTPLERNRVAIQLAIDEGEDARIKDIKIVGASAFKESTLLSEFKLSTPTWMSWYTKSDQYSRQKLTGDLEALRSYYLNRGYLEFNIESTQVSLSPDRQDVFITIVISEGQKLTVKDVRLTGDMLGRDNEFAQLLKMKSGETFSNERLQEDIKAVTERLGELGYAFASVTPIPEVDREKQQVVFALQVDPGRRVYVRTINISGNAKTRDEVIRREMRQFEASWYDAERIRLSRNRIDRLGYFKDVAVDTLAVPGTPDQVDVNVKVEERPLGSLTLGVGFSSSDNLVLSGSITQQNFMGTGTNLGLEVNTSKVRQTFAINHVDPYWTDSGISRSLGLYTRKFNPEQLDLGEYGTQSTGASIRFGVPFTEEDRVFFGLSYEGTRLTGVDTNSPKEIQDFNDEYGSQSHSYILGVGWSRDSRDSGIAPTRGRFQYANLDYATPAGDLNYYRATYGHQYFYPLTRSVTLALNADFGFGEGTKGKNYPVFKNFYVGGIGSIRGFAPGAVGGTYDTERQSHLGGNKSIVLNSELLFPLPGMAQDRTIRLFTYLDAGNVWADKQKVSFSSFRSSAGVGLSWLSPVGPLKLSMGWPLRKFENDDTQKIQFQIGTGF